MVEVSGEQRAMGEYEPYGTLNRAAAWGETAHPYGTSSTPLADKSYDTLGMKLDARAHFNQLDTEAACGGGLYDWAVVMDGDTGTEVTPRAGGVKQGDAWTAWGSIPGGKVKVRFESDGANCAPGDCSCQQGTSYPYSGATLKELEVRRYQSASWYFPPLRFPGQYFDAETDLHENWNRFYDPQTGRYWQQEPLLQVAWCSSAMLAGGLAPGAYSYSLGNPLFWFDWTGLSPDGGWADCEQCRDAAFRRSVECYNRCGRDAGGQTECSEKHQADLQFCQQWCSSPLPLTPQPPRDPGPRIESIDWPPRAPSPSPSPPKPKSPKRPSPPKPIPAPELR